MNKRTSGLLSEDLLKSLEGLLGRDIQLNSSYPYNVITVHNEQGDVISSRLEFALAGFTKEDITVNVVDSELVVAIKEQPIVQKPHTYNHRGISKRAFNTRIGLTGFADVKNIKSSFVNGLLVVDIPQKEPITTNIEIKVD